MADRRRNPRFFMSRERTHAIAEPLCHYRGVFRESVGRVPVGPAIVLALQRRGQVPVVERRERLNIALEQSVDQAVVEIDAASDHFARSCRLDSRPGDREAIRSHAERGDQVEVRFESIVMIACDPAIGTICDDAWKTAELIPNGSALALGGPGAPDLKRTAGNSP